MTKRERLEDLGRILEMMREVCDDPIWDDCTSKHSVDAFVAKYADEERREDLHNSIRYLHERLDKVLALAFGDFPDDDI